MKYKIYYTKHGSRECIICEGNESVINIVTLLHKVQRITGEYMGIKVFYLSDVYGTWEPLRSVAI